MKKTILIIATLFLTAACTTTKEPLVIKPQLTVVEVPVQLFNCKEISKFPDFRKLTDKQVAQLLVRLVRDNKECKLSLEAIQKYLEEAKTLMEAERS